jgi:hypothetical protein
MEMSAGELVDRLTIARLYNERDVGDVKVYGKYNAGLSELRGKHKALPWDVIVGMMYTINAAIWDYEAPIHSGKMDGDPVIAGILALRVRKFNAVRVAMSKLIDTLVEGGSK